MEQLSTSTTDEKYHWADVVVTAEQFDPAPTEAEVLYQAIHLFRLCRGSKGGLLQAAHIG